MSLTTGRQHRHRYPLLAPFIFWLAFNVRLLDVTARSLWFDEAVEYLSASVPFHVLPQAVVTANYQPPLYTYLLHFWLQISIHPLWLRFLSITLSMLTVAGLMRWAGQHFGARGALLAGLITAVMPTEVYYAQDVGEYALLVCTLTGSLLFLERARERDRWHYWLLWGIFSLAAIFSHYGAVIVVVPVALLTLLESFWRKQRRAVWRQVLVSGLAGLLAIPLLIYFLPEQIRRVNEIAPVVTDWSLRQNTVFLFQSVGNTFLYSLIGWPISTIPRWLGVFVLASVALLALLVWRYLPRRLFGWLIAPYAVYFILIRTGLYVEGFRYGLIFTPLFVLVLTAVMERLWRYRSAVIALALLCLVVGTELYALPNPTITWRIRGRPSWLPVEEMEEVFTYWERHRRPDDPTFVYYGAVPAFRYYLRLYNADEAAISHDLRPNVACNAQRATQLCAEQKLFYGSWSRELSPQEKIANMKETLGGKPKRLWLLFSHVHADDEKEMMRQLRESYRILHDYGQGNAAVYLLTLSE